MLTVIRGSAERAEISAKTTSSLANVLHEAIEGAQAALDSTPQLLEILKQAGVVDAGGQGIVFMLQGLERYVLGLDATIADPGEPVDTGVRMAFLDQVADSDGEDSFGYCTNFMIFGSEFDFDRIRDDIGAMGRSAVIVGDDTMIKVHIHTENPGQVLSHALGLGWLDQIRIDNMSVQTGALVEQRAAAVAQAAFEEGQHVHGTISIVAVASGEGLASALRSMGANLIVHGGQTMNPSTEELLDAIERSPTSEVILLPNNRNIVLTANKAAEISQRLVRVVPTTSVPQALAALSSFSPERPLDANVAAMLNAVSSVISLELTRAVRDVEINGMRIVKGQMIGLVDDALVASGDDISSVAANLFARVDRHDAELVTVFSGELASAADILALDGAVARAFPDAEADFQAGGQPHHLFVMSVE
jgi:DAK2 domain fusion protein YloV